MVYVGIILISLIVFSLIYAISKNKKPFKRAFLSMLLGLATLIIINLFGQYINVELVISPFSLTASACGGVPAVAAMVLINAIF